MHIEAVRLINFGGFQQISLRSSRGRSLLDVADGAQALALEALLKFLHQAWLTQPSVALEQLRSASARSAAKEDRSSDVAPEPITIQIKFRVGADPRRHALISYDLQIDQSGDQMKVSREVLAYRQGSHGCTQRLLDVTDGNGRVVTNELAATAGGQAPQYQQLVLPSADSLAIQSLQPLARFPAVAALVEGIASALDHGAKRSFISIKNIALGAYGTRARAVKSIIKPTESALRYVQCRIVTSGARRRSVKRLVAAQRYLARVHIGAEVDRAALRADKALDESALPPSEQGHDLQVVFCALDTANGVGGIVPGQVQTIHLPKTGPSSVAEFAFTAGRDARAFRARVLIVHRNRILQTLMLSAPDAGADLALRQENTVNPAFASSDSEPAADLAIVINDNPAGVPGITTLANGAASFSEPAGLDVLVKTIEALLSGTNISTAGDSLTLDSPALVALMVQLATQGYALKRELGRQINLGDFNQAARVQVVEARARAYLPVEFVYTGAPPNINAKLCPNAQKALLAQDASVHDQCQHANDPRYVCPAAFWGMSKCIERQPFGKSDQHLFQVPQPGADSLSPFTAALLAASARVATEDLQGKDGLLSALSALSSKVRLVPSWQAWRKSILAKPAASLLVLLPHTDNSPDFLNTPALEIQKKWLTSVQLDSAYVLAPNLVGPGPVVLLLGCSTALADVPFLNFVREFKEAGASIVLGTLATVHGTHATRFARTLLEKIKAAGDGRAFDEILLEVKRAMLAAGDPFVLSLAAYGHSSWRIQA